MNPFFDASSLHRCQRLPNKRNAEMEEPRDDLKRIGNSSSGHCIEITPCANRHLSTLIIFKSKAEYLEDEFLQMQLVGNSLIMYTFNRS